MRSIEAIYQELITEKARHNALAALDSTSKASVYLAFFYVVAVGIYIHEQLFEVYKKEIETIANNAQAGSLRWYKNQIRLFQYGDLLTWVNGKLGYQRIDQNKQIVTQCAVKEAGRELRIKVAKGETGSLEPLTEIELSALNAYVRNIKVAGTAILVTSNEADKLKIYYQIYYNPLIIQLEIQKNVEQTINNHLQMLEFDGSLKLSLLTDQIQQIDGITDVKLVNAAGRYGANPFLGFDRIYNSNAGYMSIDDAFALSDTITYIAE